jgi:hypothetical protein
MFYLSQRGITIKQIVKYNIGYCKDGLYSRRVIIPSYNSDGQLNYFVSRSYYPDEKMKYKNPPISKNVICLESQIIGMNQLYYVRVYLMQLQSEETQFHFR